MKTTDLIAVVKCLAAATRKIKIFSTHLQCKSKDGAYNGNVI